LTLNINFTLHVKLNLFQTNVLVDVVMLKTTARKNM